jgi:hypothetical protein
MPIPTYGGSARKSNGADRDIEEARTQKWRPSKFTLVPYRNRALNQAPQSIKKPGYDPGELPEALRGSRARGMNEKTKLAATAQNVAAGLEQTYQGIASAMNPLAKLGLMPRFNPPKPASLEYWDVEKTVPPRQIAGMGGTGAVQTRQYPGMGGTGAVQTQQYPGMGGTGAVQTRQYPGMGGLGDYISPDQIRNRQMMAAYLEGKDLDAVSRQERFGGGLRAIRQANAEYNALSDIEKRQRLWEQLDRGYSKVENIRAQRGSFDIELPAEEQAYSGLPAYGGGGYGWGGGGGGGGGGGEQQYPDWFERMYTWRF